MDVEKTRAIYGGKKGLQIKDVEVDSKIDLVNKMMSTDTERLAGFVKLSTEYNDGRAAPPPVANCVLKSVTANAIVIFLRYVYEVDPTVTE